jgi:hypothetical protein
MAESTIQNNEQMKWYHFSYKTIGFILCSIIVLLITGHLLTYHYVNKQKEDSVRIITNILDNAAKEKTLIPDIIIIGKKDSSGILLDSTLKKDLLNFLINKYAETKSKANKVFDIKPYLLSSDIKDEDKIIKHIEFLSEIVKNAVEDSKRNIDTEISKINTWVTIWIGIIGFIGIFLPIVINIKSFDALRDAQNDASQAKVDSEIAKEKSNDAMLLLDKHKEQLGGIEENMRKVGEFEKSIEDQEKRIKEIGETATNAENKSNTTERSLSLLISLFKLKSFNYSFLVHQKKPLEILIKYFEEIQITLTNESGNFNHPFVLDALRQMASGLYQLSTYQFVSRENMTLFNNLSEFISTKLEAGLTEDSFKEILKKFSDLITTLKTPSPPSLVTPNSRAHP